MERIPGYVQILTAGNAGESIAKKHSAENIQKQYAR